MFLTLWNSGLQYHEIWFLLEQESFEHGILYVITMFKIFYAETAKLYETFGDGLSS